MNKLDQIYQEFGKEICLFPFVAAFYSLNSNKAPLVMPCSSIKVVEDWDIINNSIIDTVNNTQWQALRKNFINGSCHTTDLCKTCSLAEKSGGSSPRILNNQYFSEHIDLDFVTHIKKIIHDQYKVDTLISLDYCPSNYCNYECIMCFGGASSKRKTFELKLAGIAEIPKQEFNVASDFADVLSKVQLLNFTGGETLLQKQVHKVIDQLIDRDLAKNITISLLTNASIYPKPLIEKFKQFKNVFYTVSIDGTGDVIEYQRRGAVWNDVEKNALQLIKNYDAVVNYVLTAVNIFNFAEFVKWLAKNNIDKVFISLVYKRNSNISIAVVPDELRMPFIDNLNQTKKELQGTYYETLIDQIFEILSSIPHDPKLILQFKKAIEIEDNASSKKLIDIVPEWKIYLK